MTGAVELAGRVGVKPACTAMGVNRASYYRQRRKSVPALKVKTPRPKPPLLLLDEERQTVLEALHSERFIDQAPKEIYATLLDEEVYLCSVRTMYRILAQEGEVRERRKQRRHPQYKKPELVATSPNQVWSWDITKLKGAIKGSFFHLYVIIDIFSRYIVGWMVASTESGVSAKRLIEESCQKQGIASGQLTIHSDRGPSMKSQQVSDLLIDLGILKSHGRPKVSDDNPFSESQFKTLKYRPEFPDRFGAIEDAQTFCRSFFDWYNNHHRHSGIAMLTPETRHYGKADQIIKKRSETLEMAFKAHPKRFKGKCPKPKSPPEEVWINKPGRNENTALEPSKEIVINSIPSRKTEAALLESNQPRDTLIRTHQYGELGCGGQPLRTHHPEKTAIDTG